LNQTLKEPEPDGVQIYNFRMVLFMLVMNTPWANDGIEDVSEALKCEHCAYDVHSIIYTVSSVVHW